MTLNELIPESGEIKDAMKRSLDAFQYVVPCVSMLNLHGELLHQNPSGAAFYEEWIREHALKSRQDQCILRRTLDAAYGMDPVTGSQMIILSEVYNNESTNYDGLKSLT